MAKLSLKTLQDTVVDKSNLEVDLSAWLCHESAQSTARRYQ